MSNGKVTIAISDETHRMCERARDIENGDAAKRDQGKPWPTMQQYYEHQLRKAAETVIHAGGGA